MQESYQTMTDQQKSDPPTPLAQGIGLVLFVAICLAAGGLGGIVTYPRIPNWYAQLIKPSWNPPDWVFGPVWTTLYVLMAIAAWLVWRQGRFKSAKVPLTFFGLQLALNSLWSVLFFGLQRPDLAAVEIILLWFTIAVTIGSFWRRSRVSGWLLVPYLAWVSYAVTLNVAIWQLNR